MSRWTLPLRHRRTLARAAAGRGRARLVVASLEDRAVPAVVWVTNTADSGAGSLRQALIDAASPGRPGNDSICFQPAVTGTITLASPILVDSDVEIIGPGANVLAVSGNKAVRVFDVTNGTAGACNVSISGLTVKDGSAATGAGFAIGASDCLTLSGVYMTGNAATSRGGAIDVATGGDLTVHSSTLSGNSAPTGGAVYFAGNPTGGSIEFRNCTVSGNSALTGGGIALGAFTGDLAVTGTTLIQNKATGGTGGGIVRLSGSGSVTLTSSIVWGNTTSAATGPDVATAGAVSYRNSLLGNKTGITSLTDQGGNLAFGTNPFVGALAVNGGPLPTHALLAGSPAIDKGLNPPTAMMSDGRGNGYTRSFGATDMGAFEFATAGIPTVAGTFADVTSTGGASYAFQLTFRDDVFINVANLASGQDIYVTGPNGFFAWATYAGVDNPANGSPRTASYTLMPPGGFWDGADAGVYTVGITKNAVYDSQAQPVPQGDIGQFNVNPAPNTFLVSNDNDAGPGSLRAAVALANAAVGVADVITFDAGFFASAKTIMLATGEIAITDPVQIVGPGSAVVTVSGNSAGRVFNIDNGKAGAIAVSLSSMTLTGGLATGPGGAVVIADEAVTLMSMVLTANRTTGGGLNAGGGAVALTGAGTLSVIDCSLTANKTTGAGADGGAVRAADGSTVTITNSLVSGNTANGDGGAVYQSGVTAASSLMIAGSAVVNNSATDLAGDGGGVFFVGTVGAGGFTLRNSTFSGNTAVATGGAVGLNSLVGTVNVQNSTITDNSAGSASKGGGVAQIGGTGMVQFESSVISGNFNANAPDVSTTGKAAFKTSALGSKTGITTYVDNGGNLTTGVALKLGPLANNGGPTPTHLPAADSPLVDQGTNPAGLTLDQRGQARVQGVAADIGAVEIASAGVPTASAGPFATVNTLGGTSYTLTVTYKDDTGINVTTIDNADVRVTGPYGYNVLAKFVSLDVAGNGTPRVATYSITPPGGNWDGTDAGLYTVSLEPGAVADVSGNSVSAVTFGTFKVDLSTTYKVTNANDSGAGSLRDALALANLTSAPDTITFDPAFFNVARTIKLTSGQLDVTAPATVQGTGMALLTVSGNSASRVLNVNDGSAASSMAVTLSGMTLTAGKSSTEGGGIYLYDETLTLTNVAVTGNSSTTGAGGGIFVAGKTATLTMTDCVVSSNTAGLGMSGGGIRVDGAATASITRTTISGNTAPLRGGGIYFNNGGSLSLSQSTVSGNTAQGKDGGGLYFFGVIGAGGLAVRNCTFSGNTANQNGGAMAFVSVTGTPVIQNCTVTANKATTGTGGGVARTAGGNAVNLASSIVAGNTAPSAADLSFDTVTALTGGNSLVGVADEGNFTLGGTGNLTGTAAAPLSAKLSPLANNGGPTQTHALQGNSPAIDAGSNPAGLVFEQRGTGYKRVGGKAADIGAFEIQPPPTVTSLVINDGGPQRSRVLSISVPFSTLVNFSGGNPAAAFKLEKMNGAVPVATISLAVDLSTSTVSETVAKLTFSGANVEAGSLTDGEYRLTVMAANVTDFGGQAFDGNGNGATGDNFVSTAGAIFRLGGDLDGDRDVDAVDLNGFRGLFGSYWYAADLDGDGDIDALDFSSFRSRFGNTI